MYKIIFNPTKRCRFGNVDPTDPNYDELTKVTTDPFGIDPDRCWYWQKCEKGEIVNGTCNFDERFDKVLRKCMPAIANPPCNVDECANQTRASNFEFLVSVIYYCQETLIFCTVKI